MLSPDKFRRVESLLAEGFPVRDIVAVTKVARGTVAKIRRGVHPMQHGWTRKTDRRDHCDADIPKYLPTPETIAAEAAAISASWSDEERERRWLLAHSVGWALGPDALALVA